MNSEKLWDTLEAKKYHYSRTSKIMGFQYKRCKTVRKNLMERPDAVAHKMVLRHIKN